MPVEVPLEELVTSGSSRSLLEVEDIPEEELVEELDEVEEVEELDESAGTIALDSAFLDKSSKKALRSLVPAPLPLPKLFPKFWRDVEEEEEELVDETAEHLLSTHFPLKHSELYLQT